MKSGKLVTNARYTFSIAAPAGHFPCERTFEHAVVGVRTHQRVDIAPAPRVDAAIEELLCLVARHTLLTSVGKRTDYMRDRAQLFAGQFSDEFIGVALSSTAILTTWSGDWRRADGVQLEHLDHMQRIVVRTYQHAYKSSSVAATGDVLVRGGHFLQEFTEAKLVGSSLGGGFLKQFGIYVGLRVEFNVDGETILTSPIFGISLCPMELVASA